MDGQYAASGQQDSAKGPLSMGYDRLSGSRQVPFGEEAEQAVLGAVLLDREAVGLAREIISHTEFYRREHQLIFQAMCRLYENDQAIDPITISDLLSRSAKDFLDKHQLKKRENLDLLEEAGGMDYIVDLSEVMGTAANVIYHAGIVKEKATLRNLINVSNGISAEAYEQADDAADILDRAQGKIYEISEESRSKGFTGVNSIVPGAFKSIEDAFQNDSEVTGLHTGFKEMDRKLSGLQNSDLIILAARPAMGKTSFALNLAYNVATIEKKPVGIFSLEMSCEQLVMRMICSSGNFNLHDVKRGKLRAEDWPKLTNACDKLSQAPLFIDDTSGISVLEMKAKARRLKQQHGLGLIVLDYH